MSFIKYLDSLALSNGLNDDLNSIGDPYKILDSTEPSICKICGYATQIRSISVYLPEKEKEVIVVLVHPEGKPDYCKSVYKDKTIGCNSIDQIKKTSHHDRLKKLLELRMQNPFTDEDALREWYTLINYDI